MKNKTKKAARQPGLYWVVHSKQLAWKSVNLKTVIAWTVAEWTEHESFMLPGSEEGCTDDDLIYVGPMVVLASLEYATLEKLEIAKGYKENGETLPWIEVEKLRFNKFNETVLVCRPVEVEDANS